MRILALLTYAILGGGQIAKAQEDEGWTCVTERFDLSRDERRRGILLSLDMTNIEFGRDYTRGELIARYRLYRGESGRMEPTPEDLSVAGSLITKRSGGIGNPQERLRAAPCIYIEIIPAAP